LFGVVILLSLKSITRPNEASRIRALSLQQALSSFFYASWVRRYKAFRRLCGVSGGFASHCGGFACPTLPSASYPEADRARIYRGQGSRNDRIPRRRRPLPVANRVGGPRLPMEGKSAQARCSRSRTTLLALFVLLHHDGNLLFFTRALF